MRLWRLDSTTVQVRLFCVMTLLRRYSRGVKVQPAQLLAQEALCVLCWHCKGHMDQRNSVLLAQLHLQLVSLLERLECSSTRMDAIRIQVVLDALPLEPQA